MDVLLFLSGLVIGMVFGYWGTLLTARVVRQRALKEMTLSLSHLSEDPCLETENHEHCVRCGKIILGLFMGPIACEACKRDREQS